MPGERDAAHAGAMAGKDAQALARAGAFDRKQNTVRAIDDYDDVLRLDPTLADIFNTRGELFLIAQNATTLATGLRAALDRSGDPVEALDSAASRLLVALGDAITAAGANFSFYSGEPFTPARDAEIAYAELGDAIAHWKNEVLDEQRRRPDDRADAPVDER